MNKLTHEAVGYEHPAKHMETRCQNCEHYLPAYHPVFDPHCEIVRDPIRPEDWCRRYKPA